MEDKTYVDARFFNKFKLLHIGCNMHNGFQDLTIVREKLESQGRQA